jgi:lambda family phage portal protein
MKEVVQQQLPVTMWDRVGGFIDRCALAVSPSWGAERIAARSGFREMERRNLSTFEGAKQDYIRGSNWLGSRLSPDSALEEDLDSLRNRSRELYRNDCYGGAVDNVVNHVVGTGFTPQCRISEKLVGLEASQVFREELEGVYAQWSPRCDISGRVSLWQQSRLVERHLLFDGEGLAVISDEPHPDKPIPLTIEVIDPERLETPPTEVGNKLIRLGIEKDAHGRIVAYHIRKTHPGDTVDTNQLYDRVPAVRVLHVFEKWFAGQSRGLPWLCRVLNRIKDCKDLDEAEIIAAQVQACFAVFIKKPGSPGVNAAAAASATDGTLRYQDIRPGAQHYLAAGEEIQMASPTRPGNTFSPFQEWNMRRVAAGMNYPYEQLVKNWGGISFAGGRLVLAGFRLDAKSRQKLLDEQFLCPVWCRMTDEAVLTGQTSIEPRLWAQRPWVYQAHAWTPPAWPYAITPGEEIKANIDAVNNNQKTLEAVVAETGEDLESVLAQRQRELKMQRDMNILPPDVKQIDATAEAAIQPTGAEDA